MGKKESAEKAVRDIRRKTRRRFSAEEKIRIVIESATSSAPNGIDAVDGIIEGQVELFWLKEGTFTVHSIGLSLSLVTEPTGRAFWHRSFESRNVRHYFFPERADFELVIREALDKTLNDMVDAFASNEFHTQFVELVEFVSDQ